MGILAKLKVDEVECPKKLKNMRQRDRETSFKERHCVDSVQHGDCREKRIWE